MTTRLKPNSGPLFIVQNAHITHPEVKPLSESSVNIQLQNAVVELL
jgi:hypothetical protein